MSFRLQVGEKQCCVPDFWWLYVVFRSLLFGSKGEKGVGRDLTLFHDPPTERMKRTNSASTVYIGATVGPIVRGHRRSMTVPLCLPTITPVTGEVYTITAGDLTLPRRRLDLNLSSITENSQSGKLV